MLRYLVDEDWSRREGDGSEGCHHDGSVPEVSLVLVLVPVGVLTEDGTGGKPPPAHLEDQSEIFLSVISLSSPLLTLRKCLAWTLT